MNKITLRQSTYKKMIATAQNAYPNEGCAILEGDPDGSFINDLIVMKNHAKERSGTRFVIDPFEIYKAENEMGCDQLPIGFFHTHPDHSAALSMEDKEYMIPQMIYVVMSVTKGSAGQVRTYIKEDEIIRELEMTVK